MYKKPCHLLSQRKVFFKFLKSMKARVLLFCFLRATKLTNAFYDLNVQCPAQVHVSMTVPKLVVLFWEGQNLEEVGASLHKQVSKVGH